MSEKKKRLVVRTPDLVDDGCGDLIGLVDREDYFCRRHLLRLFDIPVTAKRIHVEASRSPWPAQIDRIESVRFRVNHESEGCGHFHKGCWLLLYKSLRPFVTDLGIPKGKTGYVYIRVLYTE